MIVKPLWNRLLQVAFTIMIVAVVLLLGRVVFVLSMSQIVNSKASSGDSDPAELYYSIQSFTGDFMEPYKAYYNVGTAYAKNQNYSAAELFLETSLSKVDYLYNECAIRNNLAFTYTKLGDYYKESDLADTAETYYDKAVKTIQEAPPACFPPNGGASQNPQDGTNPPDTSGTGKSMKETEKESQDKGDAIRKDKGDSENGEDQVRNDMNQSKNETDNQADQNEQQKKSEQNQNPVQKPW